VPGWHEKTKKLQEAGKLQMIGIIQEQHPDRTRLFAQWKQMDWPLLIDSLNLLQVTAVPLTYLVDEHGVLRYERPTEEDLETFLSVSYPAVDQTPRELSPRPNAAEHRLVWGRDDQLRIAIDDLERRVRKDPNDAYSHFRLGVAYRMRYDSSLRAGSDFARAVEHWTRALEIDPNQYIFRRRIQQYGPRLDKPYPFYDWLPEARAAIAARGETPVALAIEPGGAEFAAPTDSFARDESGASSHPPTNEEPDPEGKILRDRRLIEVESVVVPPRVERGASARVHVSFRPDASVKAHWNNEVDDLVFWVSGAPEATIDQNYQRVPIPPEPVSEEERRVEFEVSVADDARGVVTLPAYALFYVCEDVDGTCLYRRKDVDVRIETRPDSSR
jgi:tetratricopeptide (TPR) repeat protein